MKNTYNDTLTSMLMKSSSDQFRAPPHLDFSIGDDKIQLSKLPEATPETTITPLSEVTNSDFMEAIFLKSFETDECPFIVGVVGDIGKSKTDFSNGGGWTNNIDIDIGTESINYYFTLATYKPKDGEYSRTKTQFHRSFGIYLDDVGTKGNSREHLDNCPPSYLIETSDGNYQAGYLFVTPVADLKQLEDLIAAAAIANFTDPGANGPATRLGRLPNAINGKYEPFFNCRLVEWHPDRRYTIDQIYDGLGLVKVTPVITGLSRQSGGLKNSDKSNLSTRVYTPRALENPVVTALRNMNLYKQSFGDGKHDITCPWVHEHTENIDSGTAYFEPNDQFVEGGFNCMHGHCVERKIKYFLEKIDVSVINARNKGTITVVAGEINGIVDAAEVELANTNEYYQCAGTICNVVTDPGSNVTNIKSVNNTDLLRILSTIVDWVQYSDHSHDVKIIDPPQKYVNILCATGSYKHFPVLKGIARQPYLRPDGSLMTTEGYDSDTCMYGVFNSNEFSVPDRPSREMAIAALNELKELLKEFSFAQPHDRSAALAMILTASIRPSLSLAPMGHIKAHQIASGKSYLSSLIAAFSSPSKPAAYAFPTNDEECSKLLPSALFESPAVIMFDNLTSDLLPFKSLCSALTEEHLIGRVLGASKTRTVGTRSLFLSSGNNVDPVKDMTRRAITISLDPQMELPAARTFQGDPCKLVLSNRPQYVSLALTIVRAYITAGCPVQAHLQSLGSFDDWTRLVRAPLVWLGMPDPATALYTTIKADPDREILGRLMANLFKTFGDKPVSVSDLVARIDAEIGTGRNSELAEVVREIAEQQGKINRRTLGRWISRHQGVIVDRFVLSKSTKSGGSERWQVIRKDASKVEMAAAATENESNDGAMKIGHWNSDISATSEAISPIDGLMQ